MGVPQRSVQLGQRAPDLPSHARIVGVGGKQRSRGPGFLEWKNHRERGSIPFHELALADERLAIAINPNFENFAAERATELAE
jgi:hypothetical protein